MKLEYDLIKETEKTREKRLEINKIPKSRIKEKITKYFELLNEEEEVFKSIEKNDNKDYIDFSKELKLLLINLAEALYNNERFQECIDIDKKILGIDETYHKSYARLYYCYKKIGKK